MDSQLKLFFFLLLSFLSNDCFTLFNRVKDHHRQITLYFDIAVFGQFKAFESISDQCALLNPVLRKVGMGSKVWVFILHNT